MPPSPPLPPRPNEWHACECVGRVFPLLLPNISTFASICTQPNIWTPPWAKCMKQTSKGRADRAARLSDLSAAQTSEHLAPGRYFDLLEMRMRRRAWQHLGCRPGERPGWMQKQMQSGRTRTFLLNNET